MGETASRKIYGTNKVNRIFWTLLTPDLPRRKRPPGDLEKEKSETMEEGEELFASVRSSSLQVVIYPQLRRPLVFPGLINGQPGKASLQQLCSVVKTKANIEKLVKSRLLLTFQSLSKVTPVYFLYSVLRKHVIHVRDEDELIDF